MCAFYLAVSRLVVAIFKPSFSMSKLSNLNFILTIQKQKTPILQKFILLLVMYGFYANPSAIFRFLLYNNMKNDTVNWGNVGPYCGTKQDCMCRI